MKKIFLLLTVFSMVFTSCDPLEDIYSEIDSNESAIVGVTNYTLTEDDYKEELEDGGLGFENEYFSSEDHVKDSLPVFLANKYPVWGEESLVNVTYNLYDLNVLEEMSTSTTLPSLNDIDGYLASNYETAPNGTFVELTYNATVLAYTLSDDDFVTIQDALGDKYPAQTANAAQWGNFGRYEGSSTYWSNDMIVEAIEALLADEYSTGQVVAVSFAAYGPSSTESFTLQYNGSKFINLNLTVTATAGTAYSFTSTDYDDVISALSADYPDQTANLANYGSIDRRDTSDNYWSDDMILEAINVVLPTATEGDIYDVSYTIYNGTTTTEVMTVKFESGSYVLNQTIAEVKTIVAKNSGDWEFPYVFSTDDYDLLGQSYGNFDSGSIYKLDIFLETLMPYAKAGDAMTVQYEYYDGSTNYRYSTSTFDGNKWNLVLDVIETSFQYGFEDGKWVPDNTINYIFLSADYDTVGASTELASDTDFTDALGNLNTYGNFNRNNGSTHWEDEMIVKAIAIVLNEINPNAADGQKYAVTISTYGASQTETFKLIKESGVWEANE